MLFNLGVRVKMNLPPETIYTPAEAATLLGISRRTVWRKCREGQLPHLRYSKRCIRIRTSDIERFKRAAQRN